MATISEKMLRQFLGQNASIPIKRLVNSGEIRKATVVLLDTQKKFLAQMKTLFFGQLLIAVLLNLFCCIVFYENRGQASLLPGLGFSMLPVLVLMQVPIIMHSMVAVTRLETILACCDESDGSQSRGQNE
ncbi:MAG: hypothetical protein U0795_16570 [Pirellulales bacterium]